MSEQKDIFDFIEAVKESAEFMHAVAGWSAYTNWTNKPSAGQVYYEELVTCLNSGLDRLIEGALGPEDAKLVRDACLANCSTYLKRKVTVASEPTTIIKKRRRERMQDADGSF